MLTDAAETLPAWLDCQSQRGGRAWTNAHPNSCYQELFTTVATAGFQPDDAHGKSVLAELAETEDRFLRVMAAMGLTPDQQALEAQMKWINANLSKLTKAIQVHLSTGETTV